MKVDVVVVTYDRPESLKHTLQTLVEQNAAVPFQILVVDNHASSGNTRPIVEIFPQVRYLEGPGRGLSSGRNAAVLASDADILLFTNDDVVVLDGWVQGLVDQFTRPEIMVVCNQVLPLSLETDAERLFHQYNGCSRGNERIEYTPDWLWGSRVKSPSTHAIGVGNSFAVRAQCFKDPEVGLFNESLGAGTPAGSADDQYFWYRVLSAGYTVVYEPSIFLCDRYDTNANELQNKLFNYGKAMIAYEMELVTRAHDWRGLVQLLVILPVWRVRELIGLIRTWLRDHKKPEYWPLYLAGVRGNLLGFGAWLEARRQSKTYYRVHA